MGKFLSRGSLRGAFLLPSQALVATSLFLDAVEIHAALSALFQEQVLAVNDDRLGTLDFSENWPVHNRPAFYPIG
jgi:hypothetical protein